MTARHYIAAVVATNPAVSIAGIEESKKWTGMCFHTRKRLNPNELG